MSENEVPKRSPNFEVHEYTSNKGIWEPLARIIHDELGNGWRV
jgi:hypothetical protein